MTEFNLLEMKFERMKLLYYLLGILIFSQFSCQDDIPVWENTTARIHFGKIDADDDLTVPVNYSFVYQGFESKRDTLYLRVNASGLLSHRDRVVNLSQTLMDSVDNAEPGVHYLPFDTDELRSAYWIPKDSVTALIPIVLVRDASLATKQFVLTVRLEESSDFQLGDRQAIERTIIISDYLTKPRGWSSDIERTYFGTYSQVKHRFMIQVSGEAFDEAFFKEKLGNDKYVKIYYRDFFQEKLRIYNTDPNHKDVPLRSEPIEGFPNGQVISFP